jgi:hypothetical protein
MARAARPWIVTKHGPIEKLEDNLWTVQGQVPGLPFSRRMTILRRGDGTLLFFNAIPLEESAMDEIMRWGKPGELVVPHDQHMIDAPAFAEKLGIPVYGPKECADKVKARTAAMAGTLDAVPGDPALRIEPVVGVKNGEPALLVTSNGRVSLLVSDVLMNNRKEEIGLFPRLLGFAGSVKLVPVFRVMFLRDKAGLKAQLERWAGLPGLTRLLPSHGGIVSNGVADALRAAAGTL